MARTHKIGISSFTYCFACGSRPDFKPEHVMTPFGLIDKAVELGAEVVQFGDNMPLEAYDDRDLERIRDYAEAHGIELEAGMRKATAERLSEYIRITHKIGARVLRLITDGVDFRPEFGEFCGILESMIPALEESGVVLGIENHDRFKTHEYAEMVQAVNHPQIGLTVDSVNSLSLEEPLDEVVRNMAQYCVCLHLKDYVIKRYNGGGGLKITGACPGTGRLNIQWYYDECCRKSEYDFNVILESWMEPCGTIVETLQKEEEWAREGVRLLKELIPSA